MMYKVQSIDEFREGLMNVLAEEVSIKFEAINVYKVNDVVKHGIQMHNTGEHVLPVFYVDEEYNRYLAGTEIGTIVQELISLVERQRDINPVSNVEIMHELDYVRDKITFKLVNYEWNLKYLEDKAYTVVGDFAKVYVVNVDCVTKTYAHYAIKKDILGFWGISIEELEDLAMRNAPKLNPINFSSMLNIMQGLVNEVIDDADIFNKAEESSMYVLTNKQGIGGAASMLYPGMLDIVASAIQATEIIILPSSIHEVIIMQASEAVSAGCLGEMISDINETQVLAEERLSDFPYLYSVKTRTLKRYE